MAEKENGGLWTLWPGSAGVLVLLYKSFLKPFFSVSVNPCPYSDIAVSQTSSRLIMTSSFLSFVPQGSVDLKREPGVLVFVLCVVLIGRTRNLCRVRWYRGTVKFCEKRFVSQSVSQLQVSVRKF